MSALEREWEPALGAAPPAQLPGDAPQRIAALLAGQRYAVLSTQGSQQPYASLLAFAANESLDTLVFATPIFTRKFKLLESCEQVAMLIDSRSEATDLMDIEAVTATGRARRISREGPEHSELNRLLLNRHPHMHRFLRAQSCALFAVSVTRYFYVVRFQDVREWRP